MATKNSSDPKPTATHHAIAFYSLIRVFRTGRMETAESLPEQLAHEPMLERKGLLVQADKGKHEPFHLWRIILWHSFVNRPYR